MKYIIKTLDAKSTISTIIDCVKKGKDRDGSEIQSWSVQKTSTDEEVLVHTPQQWDEKGCLKLHANKDNDEIEVIFCYWSTFPKEQRNDNDGRYILGRFTELILVHFWSASMKISISE